MKLLQKYSDLKFIIMLSKLEKIMKKKFKKMRDEFVNVKYPNRNAPSLVFNSFVSIFNINRAPLHNKKTNYFQLAFIT